MKRTYFTALVSLMLVTAACSPSAEKEKEQTVKDSVTATTTDATSKQTQPQLQAVLTLDDLMTIKSYQDVVAKFGAENVRKEEIPGAEGMTTPGLVAFKGTPKEIYFYLDDANPKSNEVNMVSVQVTEEKSQSVWQTASGIKLGSTVEEVEKANGKPFVISGFGWDYGGAVIEWNNGKLADFGVNFSEGQGGLDEKKLNKLMGEGVEVKSQDATLKAWNPVVNEIYIPLKSNRGL